MNVSVDPAQKHQEKPWNVDSDRPGFQFYLCYFTSLSVLLNILELPFVYLYTKVNSHLGWVYFMCHLGWAVIPRYLIKQPPGCFYESVFG